MVKDIGYALESATTKSKKPYEPLKFEMNVFGEDVILASNFETKGMYGDDWIIFDDKLL